MSNISTLPISHAHHSTPINYWNYWIPSAFNSSVTSISGAYLVTIGVLHLVGSRFLARASLSSTFVIVALQYFDYDIVHDVSSIGKSATVAMEVKLAGNDLIIERLALDLFKEEFFFCLSFATHIA